MKETLEEAAEIHSTKMWGVYYDDIHPDIAITQTQGEISVCDFIAGAKWMQERMYSEEDMLKCWDASKRFERPISEGYAPNFNELIEQFKKK